MKNEEISNKTIRDFLTGRLDEATTDTLDELSITNGEFADRLAVEQYELVDDWVAGRLTGEDLKAFKQAHARSPALREKVEVSRSLAATVLTPWVVVERPRKTGFFAGLFADRARFAYGLAGLAALIAVIGVIAVVLVRERSPELSMVEPPNTQSSTVAAATVQPAASIPVYTGNETHPKSEGVSGIKPSPEPTRRASPAFATLTLAAPTRGGGNIRSLKLESGLEYVLLSLQTEALSSRFVVEVADTTGKTQWKSGVVRGRSVNGTTIVSVRLPAAKA